MTGYDAIFNFWNNAQGLYGDFLEKQMQGKALSDEEYLTMEKLGRLLQRYYYLQRLIVEKDIKRWETNDDDNDDDDNNDGFANTST
jgi:hypothetical protein